MDTDMDWTGSHSLSTAASNRLSETNVNRWAGGSHGATSFRCCAASWLRCIYKCSSRSISCRRPQLFSSASLLAVSSNSETLHGNAIRSCPGVPPAISSHCYLLALVFLVFSLYMSMNDEYEMFCSASRIFTYMNTRRDR